MYNLYIMAKLIVGLGNPGLEYESTRHNVGFLIIDQFAKNNNIEINKEKFGGLFIKTHINGEEVFLAKPLTFMNLSGQFVNEIMNYYKIDIEDLLVVYDDKDIINRKYKLKSNGSSGGHNGIKNIISHLGTDQFKRLKIGVGQETRIENIKDYVLKKFSKKEIKSLETNYDKYNSIMEKFLTMDFIKLQEKYNGNK